jgi:PAS domain S-box-containing protein
MLTLQTVFEHSPAPMCFTKGAIITSVNPAFMALFGYTLDEVLGLDIVEDLTYQEDKEISYKFINSGDSSWTVTKRYFKKNGSLFWARVKIIRNEDELLGVFEDITAFKEVERLYGLLTQDFDTFAYSASHDLLEPLRSIRNYVEILSNHCDNFKDNEEAQETYNVIINNLTTVKKLLDGLLSYSRIGTRKIDIQELSILEIVNRCEYALASLIDEKDAQLLVECESIVRADELHLQRLLQNLIQNALKYATVPLVKIGCEKKGRWHKIWVSDNGPGIETKYFDFIFKPFKRVSDTPNGIGIGLAECKRIVELYGGRIWVESEIGKGTTFYFTLPG